MLSRTMLALACLLLFAAAAECRHVSSRFDALQTPTSETERALRKTQSGHRRHLTTPPPSTTTTTTTTTTPSALLPMGEHWSELSEPTEEYEATVYEPVVLKLELHFAPRQVKNRTRPHHRHRHGERVKTNNKQPMNKRKNKKKKKKKLNNRQRSPNNGFIHLFLPLQFGSGRMSPVKLSLARGEAPLPVSGRLAKKDKKLTTTTTTTSTTTTTTTTTTPAPTTTITSAPKKNKNKRKKNKKMNNALIESSSTSITEAAEGEEELGTTARPMRKHQQNWGAVDDGIPAVFNSLSSEETQQWARWLRCTLCLQQSDDAKSPDKESALCQQLSAFRCAAAKGSPVNATYGNELTASGCKELDTCRMWQECETPEIPALFEALPPCPCTYPTGLVYNDRVWDPLNRHYYRWREVSVQSERVDIYRPGAAHCIRSLSIVPKVALASQQCCYDNKRRLLTRGWAAGTPALVSPEASAHLSRVTERLPWLACKGDFSRYHVQRPPDNRLNCTVNPPDEEYQRQVVLATNY